MATAFVCKVKIWGAFPAYRVNTTAVGMFALIIMLPTACFTKRRRRVCDNGQLDSGLFPLNCCSQNACLADVAAKSQSEVSQSCYPEFIV